MSKNYRLKKKKYRSIVHLSTKLRRVITPAFLDLHLWIIVHLIIKLQTRLIQD